ncbi:VOC family protein [Microbacterium kyungheense]|jgi:predicted 3-demethylubiquinone-9 3-methyltransferase (glyoxalase superfamily)|uniref:Putative 3-demethylubiquinone-9 3-methyltransferase (Glyoxalase superfamily) n=1 Tax=Microbacterium kyungheense TaxID=1263636 RepID=A0A543F2W7_9MICO|nr:VOC family protein [Microbacterium kyungheense]TQM28171.1 putative 3-demethylubiquinone-9 3-methyltransferase (glyoxalase superfamily) [Microbacterium kyungheense]
MTDVTPFLWFDDTAEEAVTFYTALIPDSEIVAMSRYPDEVPGMGGKVMHVHFRLGGRDYLGMDAGPQFPFTEAVSLYVSCRDQAEVDRYWDALVADGGEEQPCGWLKDRWGLSWQVIPDRLIELIRHPDPEVAHRAVQAMLRMRRIDIAALEAAVAGT